MQRSRLHRQPAAPAQCFQALTSRHPMIHRLPIQIKKTANPERRDASKIKRISRDRRNRIRRCSGIFLPFFISLHTGKSVKMTKTRERGLTKGPVPFMIESLV